MFRLGLAVVFAIFAGIQGKKAQKSVSQAYEEMKRHKSFPLMLALVSFVALLLVTGFVLSAVAGVWQYANELGGNWFAVGILAVLALISVGVYIVARRFNSPARRRLLKSDETLFVTEDLPKPLPAPDNADQRFKRIRDGLQKATTDPKAQFLLEADIAFLRQDAKKLELIEDELKKNIRNFVDAAQQETDAAGQSAHRLAEKLIQINPREADWCMAELSTLKKASR